MPESRDDALWKGMESFFGPSAALRDEKGAVCALEWDLPCIGELVAPVRFHRQEVSLQASALKRFLEVFHHCSA